MNPFNGNDQDNYYDRPPPPAGQDAYGYGGQNAFGHLPPPPTQQQAYGQRQGNFYGGYDNGSGRGYGQDAYGDQRGDGNGYRQQSAFPPPPPAHGYGQSGGGFNPADEHQYGETPSYGQIKPQADEADQHGFHYSSCTGKRKALLIGINYFGTGGELAGCINDVHNVRQFIMERFHYKAEDMVILTDDQRDPRLMPTKDNILRAMAWLVEGAHPDDALFLHYSGHGTQVEDTDGDEGDDDDEAICPLDYEEAGLIIDDDNGSTTEPVYSADPAVHQIVVRPLPEGCRLTAIFDSCHSGTVMDLPYVYTTEGKIKGPDYFTAETTQDLMGAGVALLSGDTDRAMSKLFGAAKDMFGVKKAEEKGKKLKSSAADVIMWSGCKDEQTSADTQEEGKATGAMSYAFIAALRKYPKQSYMQLLNTVRDEMQGKYTQKPQLSASHPIDTDLEFIA